MFQCNVRQVVAAAAAEEGVETQIADCAATHKQPLTTPELIDCLMIGWLGSSWVAICVIFHPSLVVLFKKIPPLVVLFKKEHSLECGQNL